MKTPIAILFIFTLTWSCHAQFSPQSKTITDKYFPDPEIEIKTPAFQKKKGFTNYDEMMLYLNELNAQHSDIMTITFIGSSQKGKEIPMVTLSRPNNQEKLRVWIQGGLHGNEPASTEGVLYLIHEILINPEYQGLIDKLDIALVPMANIDGYEKLDRYAHNGLDLNRDQTKLHAPESVHLKQAFSNFRAEVALDVHEYKPYRKNFTQLSTFGVTNGYDVMFLYSGNLNVPESIRNFTLETFVQPAREKLDANGLTHHEYFSESVEEGHLQFNQGSLSARSSATSYALANSISTLIEIRGVDLGRTSYKRRVHSIFLVCMSYLQTAYSHSAEVKEVLRNTSDDQKEVVVRMKSKISEQPLELIDIETEEKKNFTVTLRDAWYSSPTLTRPRPTAYILLPDQNTIATKLSILGIEIDTLKSASQTEVEIYTVSEYSQEMQPFEGAKLQKVKTTIDKREMELPVGCFIVYLNQPRANLAIEVLEPEAPNSFVSFDVLHTQQGETLPIYRYLNKEEL